MGSEAVPTMSSRRPIITAGPMERNSKPRSMGSADSFGFGSGGRFCAQIRPATARTAALTASDNFNWRIRILHNTMAASRWLLLLANIGEKDWNQPESGEQRSGAAEPKRVGNADF